MDQRIGLGCDHAGYPVKEQIKKYLHASGYEVIDYGTHSEEAADYPDIAHLLAFDISQNKLTRGIIICGSGNGVSMTANKHLNVRAALCWIPEIARLARLHNDANILALPGRFVNPQQAEEIVHEFLTTAFEGGRHQRRVEKIDLTS